MLTVLVDLTNTYKKYFELIIVEYNPPRDRPYLSEVLQLGEHRYLAIKCIRVPYEYHAKHTSTKAMPLMEWRAKNIGVRRAKGEYILCTNIDILFSVEFMNFLVQGEFDAKTFYRINRHDISLKEFPRQLSGMDMLELCKSHVYRIITKDKVITNYFTLQGSKILIISMIYFMWQYIKISYRWLRNRNRGQTAPLILRDTPYHHGAAGDFLLMHRDLWRKAHGYDETPISGFMDVSILYELGCMGYSQKILPYSVYHIEHSWGRLGRPTFEVTDFNQKCQKMLDTNIPYRRESEAWGAPNDTFEEVLI